MKASLHCLRLSCLLVNLTLVKTISFTLTSPHTIFLESKMVPASGLNFLPHVLHSRIARPVFLLNPSLLISFEPQNGHSSMTVEFMKSTPSFDGFLCLASYHSEMVETIKSVDIRASENLPLRASFCLLFMFGGSALWRAFSRNRQVSRRKTLAKRLFQ